MSTNGSDSSHQMIDQETVSLSQYLQGCKGYIHLLVKERERNQINLLGNNPSSQFLLEK
tara:strand:- start:32 stop:208 length:177 start_codon:yes stop_codon:yes gene_type:complete